MNILKKATQRIIKYDDKALLNIDENDHENDEELEGNEGLKTIGCARVSKCTSQEELRTYTLDERKYSNLKMGALLGKGSFGSVYRCSYKCATWSGKCCVKIVKVDERYKNREVDIMTTLRDMPHTNIIGLIDTFTRKEDMAGDMNRSEDEDKEFSLAAKDYKVGLDDDMEYGMVEDYEDMTGDDEVDRGESRMYYIVMPRYRCNLKTLIYKKILHMHPISRSKMLDRIGGDILRGLKHLHTYGIMHRDIKPENILYDTEGKRALLCDFGSAKNIEIGDKNNNSSYVCTRWYRAPELILGSCDYNNSVDIWAAGCVLIEMITGKVLFREEDNTSMLCKIFKILGIPNARVFQELNKELDEGVVLKTIRMRNTRAIEETDGGGKMCLGMLSRILHPHETHSNIYGMYIMGCMQYSPRLRVEYIDKYDG